MQKLLLIKYLSLPIIYCLVITIISQCISKCIKYTYNNSTSEKKGLYLLYHSQIKNGAIYQVCLDNSKFEYIKILKRLGLPPGHCENGQISLLKTVVASHGDIVKVTKSGVTINDSLLPTSKGLVLYKNISLRPLPIGYIHKLSNNEYWLYGTGNNSYDSRYFGVVNSSEIINKATLLSLSQIF